MSEELMECPHCGGAARFAKTKETYGHGSFGESHFVECEACGCRSKSVSDYGQSTDRCKELAAAAWNRRVAPVVELPEAEWFGNDDAGGFAYDPDAIMAALNSAGIKTE